MGHENIFRCACNGVMLHWTRTKKSLVSSVPLTLEIVMNTINLTFFSTLIEMMSQVRPPRRGGYSNNRQHGYGGRRGGQHQHQQQQQQHHHSNRLRARDVEQALFTTTGRYVNVSKQKVFILTSDISEVKQVFLHIV